MKHAILLLILAGLTFWASACTPNFNCRRDAYAAHSHVNAGQGVLGSLAVSLVEKHEPHPPLPEMLAACK